MLSHRHPVRRVSRRGGVWHPPAVTDRDGRRRGFWFQVGRPFRAAGRGFVHVLEVVDLIGLVVQLGRGLFWLFRGAGTLLAKAFDW